VTAVAVVDHDWLRQKLLHPSLIWHLLWPIRHTLACRAAASVSDGRDSCGRGREADENVSTGESENGGGFFLFLWERYRIPLCRCHDGPACPDLISCGALPAPLLNPVATEPTRQCRTIKPVWGLWAPGGMVWVESVTYLKLDRRQPVDLPATWSMRFWRLAHSGEPMKEPAEKGICIAGRWHNTRRPALSLSVVHTSLAPGKDTLALLFALLHSLLLVPCPGFCGTVRGVRIEIEKLPPDLDGKWTNSFKNLQEIVFLRNKYRCIGYKYTHTRMWRPKASRERCLPLNLSLWDTKVMMN
jgi:hypothetical protein